MLAVILIMIVTTTTTMVMMTMTMTMTISTAELNDDQVVLTTLSTMTTMKPMMERKSCEGGKKKCRSEKEGYETIEGAGRFKLNFNLILD